MRVLALVFCLFFSLASAAALPCPVSDPDKLRAILKLVPEHPVASEAVSTLSSDEDEGQMPMADRNKDASNGYVTLRQTFLSNTNTTAD